MFSHLKNVVDLIKNGVSEFRDYKSRKERTDTVMGLLKTYFLIKDCADEGEALIREAGYDPVGKIAAMGPDEAVAIVKRWDRVLRKQGIRLYTLQGYILGQDHLLVINPALKEKIAQVVGYKMDRVVTLHGIGSSLTLRNMLPINQTDEEIAKLVAVMAGAEEDGVIDVDAAVSEVSELRASLDSYREVIMQLITNGEMLSLSSQARKETTYDARA